MGETIYCDPRKSRLGWRPPEDWVGWTETISAIVWATPGRPEMLEIRIARTTFIRAELLEKGELRSDETEGFRVFWGRQYDYWIDVVRTRTGFLRVRCKIPPHILTHEWSKSPAFNPRDAIEDFFYKAIEYLLDRPPE